MQNMKHVCAVYVFIPLKYIRRRRHKTGDVFDQLQPINSLLCSTYLFMFVSHVMRVFNTRMSTHMIHMTNARTRHDRADLRTRPPSPIVYEFCLYILSMRECVCLCVPVSCVPTTNHMHRLSVCLSVMRTHIYTLAKTISSTPHSHICIFTHRHTLTK